MRCSGQNYTCFLKIFWLNIVHDLPVISIFFFDFSVITLQNFIIAKKMSPVQSLLLLLYIIFVLTHCLKMKHSWLPGLLMYVKISLLLPFLLKVFFGRVNVNLRGIQLSGSQTNLL